MGGRGGSQEPVWGGTAFGRFGRSNGTGFRRRPRGTRRGRGPRPKRFYRRLKWVNVPMGAKFAVNDRVRINEKTFPSFDEGLFNSLPKTGTVVKLEPESILPYQVKIDSFEHHPFWFYEDQLLFENTEKEAAYAKANAPQPRAKPAAKPEAAHA